MNEIIVKVYPPVVTPEKFAIDTGLDQRGRKGVALEDTQVVDGMIKNGHLPTIKLGRHKMINLVEYTAQCSLSLQQSAKTTIQSEQ